VAKLDSLLLAFMKTMGFILAQLYFNHLVDNLLKEGSE
jgi:hypothetical protein